MSPLIIFDDVSFKQWVNEISVSHLTKGGVTITMDNPRTKAAHARKEDLLAKTIKRFDARLQGPSCCKGKKTGTVAIGRSDSEASSDGEFDDLDVYADEIYAKYGVNTEYDRFHPVYLDPTNADQYILLTSGNVDLWARAMRNRVSGVSIESPPSSLKYLRRKAVKGKAPTANASPINTSSNAALVELTKWLVQKGGHARSSPPPSSDVEVPATDLSDYLDFICIAPHKRDGILSTLLHNDIDQYHMFRSLTVEDLKGLGFNVGVISKLRSNVGRYRVHLTRKS